MVHAVFVSYEVLRLLGSRFFEKRFIGDPCILPLPSQAVVRTDWAVLVSKGATTLGV